MEEVLEYELLSFEYEVNYELDSEALDLCVCDDSGEQNPKEERITIAYDQDGIPMGGSHEETEIRRKIIHEYIQNWRAGRDDPRVFNQDIQQYIKVNQVFLLESAAHSAVRYLSTKAILQMETILSQAQRVGLSKTKQGDSNQKPFKQMMIMVYKSQGLGSIKMTVGVRKLNEEKVAYSITAPTPGTPFIEKDMRIPPNGQKKKAPHKK